MCIYDYEFLIEIAMF